MSAPRFFSLLPLVLLVALAAAGCTLPGASRLEGPPEGLPPSLDLVTADVLGFLLVDTDPGSKLWAPLEAVVGSHEDNAVLARLNEPVFGDEGDPSTWIGDHAGVALRELDIDGATEATTLYFADVHDQGALREELRATGWRPVERVPSGDIRRFVRRSGTYRAMAVHDDAVIAARSRAALETFVDAADEYSVPERTAMSEFAVEATKRSPAAFVFRSDLLRTQVRRPFEDDPALLELARWATDSNVLVALRDGWVGIAPATDPERRDEAVRVVGAAVWVPDLAPDITLGAAAPKLLAKLGPENEVVLAVDDIGQHLRELVRAITVGAGQYVTEQDVPDGEARVELLPILDRLDGDAAVGYGPDGLQVVLEDEDGGRGADAERALRHAGVEAEVARASDGTSTVTIPLGPKRSVRDAGGAAAATTAAATFRDFSAAGTPPRPPLAWFATSARGCIGDTAGWLTFDGTERMTLGMDVELRGGRDAGDGSFSLLETCTESLAG